MGIQMRSVLPRLPRGSGNFRWALTGKPVDDDQLAVLLEPWRPQRYRVQALLGLAGHRLPRRGRLWHRGHISPQTDHSQANLARWGWLLGLTGLIVRCCAPCGRVCPTTSCGGNKMRIISAVGVACSLSLTVLGLAPASHAAKAVGHVVVIQAVPGMSVDVAIDGESMDSGVEVGSVLGPFELTPGSHEVEFSGSGLAVKSTHRRRFGVEQRRGDPPAGGSRRRSGRALVCHPGQADRSRQGPGAPGAHRDRCAGRCPRRRPGRLHQHRER